MQSKKSLINRIKQNKNWILSEESYLHTINQKNKYKFKKGMIKLRSTNNKFYIEVDWLPEKNIKGFWRVRFFTNKNKKLIFVEKWINNYPYFEEEVSDIQELLHTINLFIEDVARWGVVKKDFYHDSSEFFIKHKKHTITFEDNYLIYLDDKQNKEIKRIKFNND